MKGVEEGREGEGREEEKGRGGGQEVLRKRGKSIEARKCSVFTRCLRGIKNGINKGKMKEMRESEREKIRVR